MEQQRQLTAFIDQARSALPEAATQTPALQAAEDASLDSLYIAFENRFRGSTELISQRLRRYLGLTCETPPVAAGGTVLDIGCGRGEWLALLRDANVAARGIDLNGAMAAEARGRGLDAQEGDAIAYLRGLEEGSLAAVTGFHIVEHLAFQDLVALFDAAYAALAPEGFVLFETPNPENLVVGACTFHYDPTHNKPLPPDFLRFIAETRGFSDVRIIRRDEDCQLDQPESGFAPVELNDWFRQPADYAVYARKPRLDAAS
ncbi:class I SAM-dependent methyltransferase [Tianweitania sp. BSSL-BM11]|uniref:Class I SAM-dependent methyltransferase n=2 Tax=Tianweitania aestuarii TaxID=2814886 RepID=A0ABS5RW82_9HYPH|nr:class I SAM-dependent methyltransferase [Tianweitania aestuarii]